MWGCCLARLLPLRAILEHNRYTYARIDMSQIKQHKSAKNTNIGYTNGYCLNKSNYIMFVFLCIHIMINIVDFYDKCDWVVHDYIVIIPMLLNVQIVKSIFWGLKATPRRGVLLCWHHIDQHSLLKSFLFLYASDNVVVFYELGNNFQRVKYHDHETRNDILYHSTGLCSNNEYVDN